MKVLLTGATGFVGSHLLDALDSRQIPCVVLVRATSDRRFVEKRSDPVEPREGSLQDRRSLTAAFDGVTHVIHCAGLTKALRAEEFYTVNVEGTRNLIAAANARAGQVKRFLHLSSLAASAPGTRAAPIKESSPPAPVSHYGRSKLAAEREIASKCEAEFTLFRAGPVYGPRDREFLSLFKSVSRGILPVIGGGRQELNLLYAPDLAAAVLRALTHPAAKDQCFNLASPEITTTGDLGIQVADAMQCRALRVQIPLLILRLICQAQSWSSMLSGRPGILTHGKYYELAAPGWVCDTSKLRDELGVVCSTRLTDGIGETLAWYRGEGWLK